MKHKDYTPLIMWACLVAGIIVLGLVRMGRASGVWKGHPVDFDMVFILFYLFWMAAELALTREDVHTKGKTTSDCATCPIYGAGQALTICTALWFPSAWRVPNAAHAVGLAVFILAVGYRLWAVRSLGCYYSHKVRTTGRHRIVTAGPYRFTRHPAYAGMIVANAGICVYFLNRVTASVFLFLLVPAILARIVVEEKTLFGIEGYAEFARRRKRLFPAVW
jgi:protein-S-isoprenylcysteine O-methyltransferase Ste14